MISFRARLLRFFTRQMFKRVNPDSDVAVVRRLFEKMQRRRRMADGVTMRPATVEGVACEWLVPDGCEDAPILYFLHGGAYVMGSPATHRQMVSYIAREAGVRALLPDYALAPEKPFPAGLNDCLSVYRGLLAAGVNASHIMIGGDSAGGGMSMATLVSLRDAGDALPLAAVFLEFLHGEFRDGVNSHVTEIRDQMGTDVLLVVCVVLAADFLQLLQVQVCGHPKCQVQLAPLWQR